MALSTSWVLESDILTLLSSIHLFLNLWVPSFFIPKVGKIIVPILKDCYIKPLAQYLNHRKHFLKC